MNEINYPTPMRKARLALGLTTVEAGQYVHVTRKTWEAWEQNEINGKSAPLAKTELFFAKLESIKKLTKDYGKIIVVLGVQGNMQFPIDVIAEDNYLGHEDNNVIKSMAIRDGRPYVHRTKFDPTHNPHVVKFINDMVPV